MTVRTAVAAACLLAATLIFSQHASAGPPGATGPAIGNGFRIGSPYPTPDYSGTPQKKKKRVVRSRGRSKSQTVKSTKPVPELPVKRPDKIESVSTPTSTSPVETGTVANSTTAGAPETCRKYEPTIGRTIEIRCP